jgi:hypothetical protein
MRLKAQVDYQISMFIKTNRRQVFNRGKQEVRPDYGRWTIEIGVKLHRLEARWYLGARAALLGRN